MKEIILAYQGEMTLKGLNRGKFEARLAKIIRWRLEPLGKFKVYQAQSTVFIEPKEDGLDMDEAFRRVSHVFGIVKLSRAVECPKDFDAICETAEAYLGETLRGLRTGSIDGEGLSLAAVRDCFAAFAAQESVMLTRETKKGPRTSDIRRHLLRWKELEDGSLEFSLDWSDGYLSPLLLCTSICASLGDESRLRALLRLSKTAQHFADGQVCP